MKKFTFVILILGPMLAVAGFALALPSFVHPSQVFAEQKFERASQNLRGLVQEKEVEINFFL